MEEVAALLAGNFEADVTVALSRDNWLLTFAAHDDGSEFHRPPPQLCFFLVGALLPTCDLLTFVTCAVLVGRSQDQVKTRSQRLQQLVAAPCRNQLPQPSLRTDPPSALFPVLVGLRMLLA